MASSACGSTPPKIASGGVDLLQIPTPTPDPADFVAGIDNPWFPLSAGRRWTYSSTGDEGRRTVTVTVARRARQVQGVRTTVVREVVTDPRGRVRGEAIDYYAQDRAGNVWLFGETTPRGSWLAGVDGAQAGVAMLADPRRGDGYAQEWYAGQAEDRATVLGPGEPVTVPAGTYGDVLLIEEATSLEPGVVERQTYARGVGLVHAKATSGTEVLLELTSEPASSVE